MGRSFREVVVCKDCSFGEGLTIEMYFGSGEGFDSEETVALVGSQGFVFGERHCEEVVVLRGAVR